MSEWINVEDRLPEVVYEADGSVNCVMIYKKDGWECGSDFHVSNAAYAHNRPDTYTHWRELPAPPDGGTDGD